MHPDRMYPDERAYAVECVRAVRACAVRCAALGTLYALLLELCVAAEQVCAGQLLLNQLLG